ncbi:hypothetical protein M9458_051329 [Cirrhinus mrigala]|uniref:Uncharacterized protein n=1 Tax=Cirrhinus mrigala TaxID=683832 RepID=A0ABD0MTL0_CIRMR
MDPLASRLTHSVTECTVKQGSSSFTPGHSTDMDTNRILCRIKQGPRTLEQHIREPLAIANYSTLPDCIIIEIFSDGVNQPLRARLRREGPRTSLAAFMDFALLCVGSPFTVGVAEEERDNAVMAAAHPACKMAAAPERVHTMAATTESVYKMAAAPERAYKMAATEEAVHKMAARTELRHVTAAIPEPCRVAVFPESSQVSKSSQVTAAFPKSTVFPESSQLRFLSQVFESNQVAAVFPVSSKATAVSLKSSKVTAMVPESSKVSPERPEPLHKMAATPEPLHKMATTPEPVAKMAATSAKPAPANATSAKPQPVHVMFSAPESVPVMAALPDAAPESSQATAAAPESSQATVGQVESSKASQVTTVVPVSSQVKAVFPASSQVRAALPKSSQITAAVFPVSSNVKDVNPASSTVKTAFREPSQVTTELHKPSHVSSVGPEPGHVMSASVMAITIFSMWTAHYAPEIPSVTRSAPEVSSITMFVPEVSSGLPEPSHVMSTSVMAITILSMWAAHYAPEVPPGHKPALEVPSDSAPRAFPVREAVPMPPEVSAAAVEPHKEAASQSMTRVPALPWRAPAPPVLPPAPPWRAPVPPAGLLPCPPLFGGGAGYVTNLFGVLRTAHHQMSLSLHYTQTVAPHSPSFCALIGSAPVTNQRRYKSPGLSPCKPRSPVFISPPGHHVSTVSPPAFWTLAR